MSLPLGALPERPLVLVTGATDGIGLETALELTRQGADVLLHGRNAARLQAAWNQVASLAGAPVPDPLLADFSSLAQVADLAQRVMRRDRTPDVLIANAGVYMTHRETSRDGIELTMAVNHVAHALLVRDLAAHPACRLARVVVVSSIAHQRGRLELDDLALTRRPFDAYGVYAASKLANLLFAVEGARRWAGRFTVNALHPGVVSTKLLTEGFGMQGPDSLAEGARTSVKLALAPDLAGVTGGYFAAGRPARTHPIAQDAAFAGAVFDGTEALIERALKGSG